MTTKPDTGAQLRALYSGQGGVYAAFSSKVADYIASRPDYPAALFDSLHEVCAPHPVNTMIADIGAGTGLLTRGLLERGYRVVAVEPSKDMRAAADAALRGYPQYRSVDGSAEVTTLDDASVDLITSAQAFHWFDVELSRREFLRILKPAGQVALIWNEFELADPLQRALDELLGEFGGDKHRALAAQRDHAKVLPFFGGAPTRELDWPHEHRLDRNAFLSLVFSRSYMPAPESAEGQRAIQKGNALFDIYAQGGAVTVRYRTVATMGRPVLPVV